MPEVVIASGLSAGAATGLGIAAGTVTAATALSYFGTAFATSIVLGAVSKALVKKPNYSALDQGQTLTTRNATGAHNVIYGRTRVGGNIVYMAVSDSSYTETGLEYVEVGGESLWQSVDVTKKKANGYLHLVIALAGHEIDAVEAVYTATEDGVTELQLDGNGISLSSSKYGNKIRVQYKLGTDDQTAFDDLISDTADLGDAKWTSNHRVRGSALAYVRLEFDKDKFVDGVPTFSFKVRGKKVYDPRTSTTAWSSNAALCLNDYLTNSRYGLGCDYATEIDETSLIAAANVCDEDVTLSAGGTENRYECNGVISTSNKPDDIISKILTSMAGKAVWSSGRWRIIPGVYYTPTLTFDENDLRGPLQVQTLISRRDSFNSVKGVFSPADEDYIPTSFPQVVSSTGVTQDGESVFRDIELPFTTSASMAQRLAKIELLKIRQQITTTLPLKLQGLKANVGDIVSVNNTRFGWSAKKFEVVSVNIGTGEVPGVDLSLREISTDVFDWSTSEEQAFDPAPNTSLPSAFSVGNISSVRYDMNKFYGSNYGAIVWECDDAMASQYKVVVDGTSFTYDPNKKYSFTDVGIFAYLIGYELIGSESFARLQVHLSSISQSDYSKFEVGSLMIQTGNWTVLDSTVVTSFSSLTIARVYEESLTTDTLILDVLVKQNRKVVQQSNLNKLVVKNNSLYPLNITVVDSLTSDDPSKNVYVESITTEKQYGAVQLVPGPYYISVTPINVLGIAGKTSKSFITIPNPPLPNRVSGLELDLGENGESNGTEWTGRDVKIKWRHASFTLPTDINSDEPNGADYGGPDDYLKDYMVSVYNASGVLLRTEYVTTNAYVYTYEKNAEDAAKQGSTAYRTLSFKVWARGKQNQISEKAATL